MKNKAAACLIMGQAILIVGCADPGAQSDASPTTTDAQTTSGGFDYNRKSERTDADYVGWCVSALKAAPLGATNNVDIERVLQDAMQITNPSPAVLRAIEFLKKHQETEPDAGPVPQGAAPSAAP